MNLHDISKKYILNDAEITILKVLIDELSKGNEKISIRNLASKTYVSTTTIIKLAKKLGFIGYSQMIYVMNENFHQRLNIDDDYDLNNYINKKDISAVTTLIEDIHMNKNKKIYLVGIGFSDIIVRYFAKRLSGCGIFVYDGAPIDCIDSSDEPTLVIVFSKSGETNDLIQIINLSKKMGYNTYAITTSRDSTIANLCDYHIELEYKHNKLFDTPDYYVGTGIFLVENLLSEVLKK